MTILFSCDQGLPIGTPTHASDRVLLGIDGLQSVDGIKITQMLKGDLVTAKLPIILATAHTMEGDRENFSGADDYISKPVVDHQAFVDKMVSLLPTDA